MKYLELPRPSGDGLCSDNNCPCPEVRIPRGTGYLYISQEVVDLRRDARRVQDAIRKMARLKQQLEQQTGRIVIFDSNIAIPLLVCEQGARLRELDLEVAAADAKYWWETGLAPLRATPLAGSRKSPSKLSESAARKPDATSSTAKQLTANRVKPNVEQLKKKKDEEEKRLLRERFGERRYEDLNEDERQEYDEIVAFYRKKREQILR